MEARVGEPIWIKLRLKSLSYRSVKLSDTWLEHDFQINVVDADGKEPPRTKFGQHSFLPETLLRSTWLYLDPGQELQATIEITKVYQLTHAGVYSIRASRIVAPESKEDAAAGVETGFSNTVTFAIRP
jgi:hypothetical protein